ncbi:MULTISPECIES: EAL domain-containing protein [unclassified Beijerinckia]|uniref:putative bifunctional diguanylate cyclase/phosphodiesterase n=1 Tax=unclassified Beijerinckia TaxID=2638183 RepID=UPI00089BB4D2|nr:MULTISPECIES: EAL domain-containing protein [unclassified Beijerinckia]MDH7795986.1 diguanylate cyclase (GGDEF)-like protein/PAS domain S-box-containing protein [Beijerinckia sp. GAS462]SEC25136.1 diguanylate cyclase/phosphodiesterase [Beijerinckia sp. 28-YEA-48]
MGVIERPIEEEVFPDTLGDVSTLRRKWFAALHPGEPLPAYEEVVLGSMGRLANHMVLLQGSGETLTILRTGRALRQWLGQDAWDTRVSQLAPEYGAVLSEAAANALTSSRPYATSTYHVTNGIVCTFDIYAMPVACRWGPPLISAYVSKRGEGYSLVDTIFRATDDGFLALAACRDANNATVDFRIVDLNQGASFLLQCSTQALRWCKLSEGKHDLASPVVLQRLSAVIESGAPDRFEVVSSNGTYIRISVAPIGDLLSATLTDVTDLKRREQSFRLLFENNPMPMWVFDEETFEFLNINDAAITHYGYSREQFLCMKIGDIWPNDARDGYLKALQDVQDNYQSRRSWRHIRADGSDIEVLTFGRAVDFGGRGAFLVSIIDVTERRKAEARISYMAHHDALTDLPNRVMLQQRLQQTLEQCARLDRKAAVLCIDLDMFKNVNDSFGHPVGDRLLQQVAQRLKASLGIGDLAARFGGDEFALVLDPVMGPAEAGDRASRLIETLSVPYDIEGREVTIGASLGIAIAPLDGDTSDTLLRNADMALYRAKADGGGAHRFFEMEMDRQAQARRALEVDLRLAMASGELELHYQPLVNLAADRITSFEALLRWPHAERGMVSPEEFIPVAEDIGLIVPIGEWVLRTACADAATWPSDVKVAVNLSPAQFKSRNLVPAVMSALAHSGLSADRLEIEITESVLLAETDTNLQTLHQLRGLGVRISMDDFGTGYSSLSYLRSFPFDKIKIDRSFIRDLPGRADCIAIVRAISGMAQSLSIATTAEGVETREQLDQLRMEGCTEVQGFLFSPARPASSLGELLTRFGGNAGAPALSPHVESCPETVLETTPVARYARR